MHTREIVLLVVEIVGGNLVLQALIWTFVLRWVRGRRRRVLAEMNEELLASGERIRRESELALYRGSTAGYSEVIGSGVIALTDHRLLFRKLAGGRVEVPLDEVTDLREAKWFRHSYRGGRQHLILKLRSGIEVGFMVTDEAGWLAALRDAIRGATAAQR